MSLTKEIVTRTHFESEGQEITADNLDAFIRLCAAFDCLESESYKEAHEKLCASLDSISEELAFSPEEQHREILWRRYGQRPKKS